MYDAVSAAVTSARKVFGPDIEMMVARCPAWGNDDCCILVYGAQHALAAHGFARVVKGAQIEQQSSPPFMGTPGRTYSAVTFSAAP
jgi:L-asparaginase II